MSHLKCEMASGAGPGWLHGCPALPGREEDGLGQVRMRMSFVRRRHTESESAQRERPLLLPASETSLLAQSASYPSPCSKHKASSTGHGHPTEPRRQSWSCPPCPPPKLLLFPLHLPSSPLPPEQRCWCWAHTGRSSAAFAPRHPPRSPPALPRLGPMQNGPR